MFRTGKINQELVDQMKQLAVQDTVHSSEPASKQQVNRHHSICVKSVKFIFISNNNQKSYLAVREAAKNCSLKKYIYPYIQILILMYCRSANSQSLTVFWKYLLKDMALLVKKLWRKKMSKSISVYSKTE